jgi:type VI secretion system protein ImpD
VVQRSVNAPSPTVTLAEEGSAGPDQRGPAERSAGDSYPLIDAILDGAFSQPGQATLLDSFLDASSVVTALAAWLGPGFQPGPNPREQITRLLGRDIALLDDLINRQVNAVLHHPTFQRLEASWRGLRYLVEQTPEDENVKILALTLSFDELKRDLLNAIEFDQSVTFRKVYSEHFDMPGGEPIGALIGDYEFSNHPQHVEVLEKVAGVAAAAFSPFIAGAHPGLFNLGSFAELERPVNLSDPFKNSDALSHLKWRQLRKAEDSRFVALALPRVLLRAPYRDDPHRVDGFRFAEEVGRPDRSDHLWGNAAFAFGGVLVRTFAQSGWLADIRGARRGEETGGLVTGLPLASFPTDRRGLVPRCSTDVIITDALDRELGDIGFLPLCWCQDTDLSVFSGSQSIQDPKAYNEAAATANARMSTMLQYVFCASRFGHYVKVRAREKVGSTALGHEFEEELRQWLLQYTNSSPNATGEIKARYPLRDAHIEITEVPGKPGRYHCAIYLMPQFQLDQLVGSIKLSTQLVTSAAR